MKKYRGLSLEKGLYLEIFSGKYLILLWDFLFLYTAVIFLKQVGGVKKFLPEKMISLGGGVFLEIGYIGGM